MTTATGTIRRISRQDTAAIDRLRAIVEERLARCQEDALRLMDARQALRAAEDDRANATELLRAIEAAERGMRI